MNGYKLPHNKKRVFVTNDEFKLARESLLRGEMLAQNDFELIPIKTAPRPYYQINYEGKFWWKYFNVDDAVRMYLEFVSSKQPLA